MPHNQIKIISNEGNGTLSFYIKSEQGNWTAVSNSSELSRRKFTSKNIRSCFSELLEVINRVYDPQQCGIEIYFEGSAAEAQFIRDFLASSKQRNISLVESRMEVKIVVAGKIHSGKTTFIMEMGHLRGYTYKQAQKEKYAVFTSEGANDACDAWYEIHGIDIDIGADNMQSAKEVLSGLVDGEGISTFVYCLGTAKIEREEELFINGVCERYPNMQILVVMTNYISDNSDAVPAQISKCLGGTKVIPVLAKELVTRKGTIVAYGLDEVNRFIYGEG